MNTSRTRNLGRIALFAALMAVCAWIVVPAPIPFTMQTFAIFLAAAVLGGKGGVIATMVYIALGVLGLPVFSGGKAGIGVLFGATGGYIIVREDGEVLCYHLFNRNEFENYLLKNTKFETASTSRHQFGDIYKENGKYFIKLNLQVRFIK